MKKLILISIAILFAFSINAQDAKAKAILDKASAKARSFKTIYAEFTFALDNQQEDISETYSGKLWTKGEKYKLEIMGTTTYFDGKTIWTHMKEVDEVNIAEPDPDDDQALNPAKIWTMHEKGFKYYYKKEKFEANRPLQYIDLIPTEIDQGLSSDKADVTYSRITLKIDKSKSMLYSMIRYGDDGNIYTIKVAKYKTNDFYFDTMFKFDKTKHPDVEINDLR